MIKYSYRPLLVLVLTICAVNVRAQGDEAQVKTVVNQLFDAMKRGDSSMLRSVFAPGAMLQSVNSRAGAEVKIVSEPVDSFCVAIGRPHKEVYDERISFESVKIDGDLANVYAPYKFYVGETFSHCGVDVFLLVRLSSGWKIQYLIDTRRRQNCD